MTILNHIKNLIQITESALTTLGGDVAKMAVGVAKTAKYAVPAVGLGTIGKYALDAASSAAPAASDTASKATSHIATKSTGAVQHAKTAAVQHKVNAVQHAKAAAVQHKTAAATSMKKDLKDINDNYTAKKAAIDADEVKNQAALKAKHAAVNSKLAAQRTSSALPSQQAYKARFDSAASGHGAVPSQWYKDRPGNKG